MAKEILVVASKVKAYVRENYDMSTSADVYEGLSNLIEKVLDEACEAAGSKKMKTVKARFLPEL